MIGRTLPPWDTPVREIASCDLPASRPAWADWSTRPVTVVPALAITALPAVRSASSCPVNVEPGRSVEETWDVMRIVSTVPAGTETGAAATAGAAAGGATAAGAGAGGAATGAADG